MTGAGDRDDVERYEQLRAHALGGDRPAAARARVAAAPRRGRLDARVAAAAAAPAARPAPVAVPAAAGEIVGVLATMALACLAA